MTYLLIWLQHIQDKYAIHNLAGLSPYQVNRAFSFYLQWSINQTLMRTVAAIYQKQE